MKKNGKYISKIKRKIIVLKKITLKRNNIFTNKIITLGTEQ